MPHSQNGYSANDTSVIATYTIPRSSERISLRKGSAGVLLLDLLGFIHDEVVNFDQHTLDEWGYAPRTIRGSSTTLSNHASGTATDVDAQKHPLGASGTWSAAAVSKIEDRLRTYSHIGGREVIRWGRDYHGRKDEMHFEIVAPPDAVIAVANAIRQGRLGGGRKSYLVGRAPFTATAAPTHTVKRNPYPDPHVNASTASWVVRNDRQSAPTNDTKWVQWAIAFSGSKIDGFFGPGTEAAVKSWQRAHRLSVDGKVGPKTYAALRNVTR